MTDAPRLRELSATEVNQLMRHNTVVLVDVREPQEFAAERIPGALLFPLSGFNPAALPLAEACQVVFHCGSGKRSAMAVEKSLAAGVRHMSHMSGGLQAWKAAGLPTVVA